MYMLKNLMRFSWRNGGMKHALLILVVLAGFASAASAGVIDFESVPLLPDPRGHEVFVGDTYDVWGVNFFSKSNSHPRWNYNVYGNSGWFVIGGYQTPPYFPGQSHMAMVFDKPMSGVSMDLLSISSIHFSVYDEANQLIAGIPDFSPGFAWHTKTITAPPGRMIKRIDIQGNTNGYVVAMDNLNYVPGPPVFGDPIPGGGDKTFQVDAGEVTGDGVVEIINLSATHKVSATASGADPPDQQSSTVIRNFTFQRDDGLSDPTSVYIGGWLDGLLAGEFGGEASVEASVTLSDASGDPLGNESFTRDLTAPIDGADSDNIHQFLLLEAMLTPGETYVVSSTLSVAATANGGTAQAIFDNSWNVAISGTPEPATLTLLALGGLTVLRKRRRRS